jgi:hypothetical protein
MHLSFRQALPLFYTLPALLKDTLVAVNRRRVIATRRMPGAKSRVKNDSAVASRPCHRRDVGDAVRPAELRAAHQQAHDTALVQHHKLLVLHNPVAISPVNSVVMALR